MSFMLFHFMSNIFQIQNMSARILVIESFVQNFYDT